MERIVRLNGNAEDLADLLNDLQDEPIHITKRNEDYYLESPDFYNKTNQEVFDYAKVWIKKVNYLMKIIHGDNPRFDTNCVQEIDDNGTIRHHVFISVGISAGARIKANGVQINANGNIVKSTSKLPILLKINNSEVDKALELFDNSDWINLYKIYEIIKDDLGNEQEIVNQLGISKNELKLFTRTANSRNAIGDKARHATLKDEPPKTPMSEYYAKEMIKEILNKWLDIKSN